MRYLERLLFFGFFLVFFSCHNVSIDDIDKLYSEQDYISDGISQDVFIGSINAVKKAYQLTDITFTPLLPIEYNLGMYNADTTYTGMIYSSVKEIGTYVGSNVSFHTFMTAVHNPRSRIYTEKINHAPYHGTNCKAYYGTVCSGLVSYALGLDILYGSYDFVASDEMEDLHYSNPDEVHIADVLWRDGHVAIITDVIRDNRGKVVFVEYSEAAQHGCTKRMLTRDGFKRIMETPYEKVLRYKHLENNTDYTPAPEFVAVMNEVPIVFEYNNKICVDKGDLSCYLAGEDVILNTFSDYDYIEIKKDGKFYSVVESSDNDIRMSGLPFGTYEARIVNGGEYSNPTSWIVVDYTISSSQGEGRILFSSKNSKPVSISFCNRSGSRGLPFTEILCRCFTQDEIILGTISIPSERLDANCPYFIITFSTDFGIITTTPIKYI